MNVFAPSAIEKAFLLTEAQISCIIAVNKYPGDKSPLTSSESVWLPIIITIL